MGTGMTGPAGLYTEFAAWWPLLSPPEEYAWEAALYERVLLEACAPPAESMLELGSGGGSNAFYLKRRFRLTFSDLSAAMLAQSERLNPGCEHVRGDMRTLRLGRTFDCVFVHDAICYMTSEADLRAAIGTAVAHCRAGGAVLLVPDFVRETFVASESCGGSDGVDGEGLRYLEWTWDPDSSDDTYLVDYACLLRGSDGNTRAVHDRHVEGLFARAVWLRLMHEAGLDARAVDVHPADGSDMHRVLFVGTKPSTA